MNDIKDTAEKHKIVNISVNVSKTLKCTGTGGAVSPALVAQCTGTGGAECKGATPLVEQ